MAGADQVACCRIGFTEVYRALTLSNALGSGSIQDEWERYWEGLFIIEADDALVRRAGVLAVSLRLRSLDALHIAAAESIQDDELRVMTWDRRMAQAAKLLGIATLPESLD